MSLEFKIQKPPLIYVIETFLKKHCLNIRNLGISALFSALFLVYCTKYPYFPLKWLYLFAILIPVIGMFSLPVALVIGVFIIGLSLMYQRALLGLFFLMNSLFAFSASKSGERAEVLLFTTAVPLLAPYRLELLPILLSGMLFGKRAGVTVGILSAVQSYIFGLFTGDITFGYFYIGETGIPALKIKPAVSFLDFITFLKALTLEEFSLVSYLGYSLSTSPVIIMEAILWGVTGAIPALVLGKSQGFLYELTSAVASIITFSAGYLMTMPIELDIFALSLLTIIVWVLGLAPLSTFYSWVSSVEVTAVTEKKLEPIVTKKEVGISWDDVGGLEGVKKELREWIEYPLKNPHILGVYGIKLPKGVLLYGPPGCGKTLLARAVSSEAKATFIYVKASDLITKWLGESAKNVARLFMRARKNAPSIIFIDEVESLLAKREDIEGAASDEVRRVITQFLAEMDGLEKTEGVVVIGATNKPEMIDEAFLRPGRFDRIIYIPPPDLEARKQIFRVHLRDKPVAEDVDINELARMTERYSGADIELICNEAAMMAVRDAVETGEIRKITFSDFKKVIERIKPSITLEMLRKYERLRKKFARTIAEEARREAAKITISWDEIGDYEEIKEALKTNVIIPLTHPELFAEYKVRPTKGVLLYGPPGCGKTMLVKAVASSINATLLVVNGPEIVSRWAGEPEAKVREIFDLAKERAPSIIFFDEIDAIARGRGADEISTRIVAQLLTEMDGMEELKGVVVLAATNRPEEIDLALLRPGRFDKVIYIPPPDEEARKAILRTILKDKKLAKDVDIDELAKRTDGFSGADLALLCNEASLIPLKQVLSGELEKPREITMADFEDALSRIKPSLTREVIKKYESIRKALERK